MKTSGYTPISIARRLAGEVKQEREHQFKRHDSQGNNVSLSDRFQRTIKSVYLHLHSKNMGSTITLYVKYTYPIYNLTRREENPKRKEEENPQRREMKRSKKRANLFSSQSRENAVLLKPRCAKKIKSKSKNFHIRSISRDRSRHTRCNSYPKRQCKRFAVYEPSISMAKKKRHIIKRGFEDAWKNRKRRQRSVVIHALVLLFAGR